MKTIGKLFLFVLAGAMFIFAGYIGIYGNDWLTEYRIRKAKNAAVERVVMNEEYTDDRELLGKDIYRFARDVRDIRLKRVIETCDQDQILAYRIRINALIAKIEIPDQTPKCVAEREWIAQKLAEDRKREADRVLAEKRKKEEEVTRQKAADRAHEANSATESRYFAVRKKMVQRVIDGQETAKDRETMAGLVPDVLELARLRGKNCLTECERQRLEIERKCVERFIYTGDVNFNALNPDDYSHRPVVVSGVDYDSDLTTLPQCGTEGECRANPSQ